MNDGVKCKIQSTPNGYAYISETTLANMPRDEDLVFFTLPALAARDAAQQALGAEARRETAAETIPESLVLHLGPKGATPLTIPMTDHAQRIRALPLPSPATHRNDVYCGGECHNDCEKIAPCELAARDEAIRAEERDIAAVNFDCDNAYAQGNMEGVTQGFAAGVEAAAKDLWRWACAKDTVFLRDELGEAMDSIRALLPAGYKSPTEVRREALEEAATIGVDAIWHDFTDRRGLRQEWDRIARDIQVEIIEAWRESIRALLPTDHKSPTEIRREAMKAVEKKLIETGYKPQSIPVSVVRALAEGGK